MKFYYKFELFTEDTNVRSIYGEFANCDHSDTELGMCPGDNENLKEFYFVYSEDNMEKFNARQKCDVPDNLKDLFKGDSS